MIDCIRCNVYVGVYKWGEASCFYPIRISIRTTPPIHLYTTPSIHDYGDTMSKEETVYVTNHTTGELLVTVTRDGDGDIEVDIAGGAKGVILSPDSCEEFTVPAGDE